MNNKLFLFISVIFLVIGLVNAAPDFSATHSLMKNWTFDDETINSTTRGGSNNWNLQTASGVTGNYLKYTGSTTTQYGYLYMANNTFVINDDNKYIIQGWVNNKLTTDHSWLGIMKANATDIQDTVGVSMHGNNYYHHNWTVRGTAEILSIYSAPNTCNGTADTWRYIQINITNGLAYVQTFTNSNMNAVVCNNGVQRVFTMNMSTASGIYRQGYIGFGAVSSAAFDNIEMWVENKPKSLLIKSGLVNTTNINYADLSINYNGTTTNVINNTFNCNLRNGTNVLYSAVNVDLTQNHKFNVTFPEIESIYMLNINCSNSETYNTTKSYLYKVDLVEPYIYTNFVNGTEFTLNDSFLLDVNFSDANLYAYNVTYYKDSNSWKNDFNDSLSVLANYQYELLNNETGNYSIFLESWDSHTKYFIEDTASIKDNKFEYKGIKFYCDNQKEITYIKEKDRFKPSVTFNSAKKDNKCYWESDISDLIKVNSGYSNHYISLSKGIWIDEPNKDVTAVLKGNKIEFTINSKDAKDKFITDSIGDLNYNSILYNYEVTYTPPVIPPSNETTNTTDAQALNNIASGINNLSGSIDMIGYIFLLILNMFISYLLITKRLDFVFSFFNGIFSFIMVVVFFPITPIIGYLSLLLLVLNMIMFFGNGEKQIGKVY